MQSSVPGPAAMTAATRGVILAIAAVIIGVIVLGQGFSDDEPTLATAQPPSSSDDSGDDGGDGGTEPADDGGEDDAGAGDDTGGGDDGATDGGDGGDGAATDDGGTDGTGTDGTDAPSILHPPAEVRVLVANGTTVAGLAGRTADELQTNRGYNTLTPTNVTSGATVDATSVYYVPGYELDARQIAQILDAPPESVAPMPEDPPVDDLAEAHVLVVIGPDLVPS